MLTVFFPPSPLSRKLSLFSSIHRSLPPCRKHKVCRIHWTVPAFSPRPHRLGSRAETDLPLAQPRARPPRRPSRRGDSLSPEFTRDAPNNLNAATTGTQGPVLPEINMQLYAFKKKKKKLIIQELCCLGLNFSSKKGK